MTSHELARLLLKYVERPVEVSMDPKQCKSGDIRVFGDVLEVMEDISGVIIICEGDFNLSNKEVIDSINS
jgi:hypothetical protein